MLTLRAALRQLWHAPGYTSVALLMLTLGIGVNSSMFSVLDALLFRSAPYPEPDRIVQLVAHTPRGTELVFSKIEEDEIRAQQPALESLTTYTFTQFVLGGDGEIGERLGAVLASADLFTTFGVQPMLGRGFTPEETAPGANQVVLLSHGLWQGRFGGDPAIVGRTLRLGAETVTVIGVMPPGFEYRRQWNGAVMWRPLNYTPEQEEWRDYRTFVLMGRLAPARSPAEISASLDALAQIQQREHPDIYSGIRYEALPLHEALMDQLAKRISWLLTGLAGFVLLIACANLANLQLARATIRARELAIRAALGASRRRLIGQQLVESILLAVGGGLLGLPLAWAMNQVIGSRLTFAGGLDIALDLTVVGVTFALALITGVFFGVVPAWLGSRFDINAALKSQARGTSGSRESQRLRQALIVGEITLALVLLSGAAMMHRGFDRFLRVETGWDTDRIVAGALPSFGDRYVSYDERVEAIRQIQDRLETLPGVESAAFATSLPIYGYNAQRQILMEGQTAGDAALLPTAFHTMVTPNYFETVGIELVRGQTFTRDLSFEDPGVAIINESLAQQLWPNEDPIGRRLGSMDSGTAYWLEVIGVVRDVKPAASLSPPATRFTVYKPVAQEPWGWTYVVLRGPAPGSLIEPLRRSLHDLDPALLPDNVATVDQLVDQWGYNLRLAGQTLSLFGLLGLVLSAIGVYGVIANLVAQRTGEFGIRMALGAQPADVRAIVLQQALTLSGIGLVIGFGGAWALGRFLHANMPLLVSIDPVAILAVAGLLVVVALGACWFPARRAMQVDPMVALRDE